MILGKLQIQNFKSIKNTGWIYLSKKDLITIIAGQNESGKTSLLRALRFFEEGAYDTFKEDDERLDSFPRVDLVFYLSSEEYEALKSLTNKSIADYYKANGFQYVRGDAVKEDYAAVRYTYPDDIKALVTAYNEALTERVEKFDPWAHFKSMRPEIILYSSFTDNILPGKVLHDNIATNQAIQDFQNVYDVDFQVLLSDATTDQKRTKAIDEVNKKATDSLNTYWNQKISGEEAEYKYQISVTRDQTTPSLSYVNFFIDQGDGMPLKISQKSQGFQWFSGFVLRLRAHESALKTTGLILLIDEPGQGLHEVAQQDVKNVIEEISKNSNVQVIYSTHQPILLGKEDVSFSRLLLVDRDNGSGSTFKTISQLISSDGSLDALAPIRSALGMVTITDPINKKTTAIVEGITEYFYFKTLFGDKYTIIPSAGVDQVPNIFAILFGWGVDGRAIVDDDAQGKKAFGKIKKEFFNTTDSPEFKRAVLKIDGQDGIEDLIDEVDITAILADYSKTYNTSKSKVENVKQVGKFIFAKSFFDKYSGNLSSLNAATTSAFKEIEDFLKVV
jgi:predicted ATP-dependent endonuclease of OLD family